MWTFEDRLTDVSTGDLLRVINSNKEYFIVNYSVSNSGAAVWINCTNTYKDIGSSSTYNGYDFIFTMYDEEYHTIQALLIKRLKNIVNGWLKYCYEYSSMAAYLKQVYNLSMYNYHRLLKIDRDHGCRW